MTPPDDHTTDTPAWPAEFYELTSKQDRDFVVLPRDALFEFFGAMALPPWRDVDGTWIGRDIDCAPIAQRIGSWIDEHDLSDVHIGAPRD